MSGGKIPRKWNSPPWGVQPTQDWLEQYFGTIEEAAMRLPAPQIALPKAAILVVDESLPNLDHVVEEHAPQPDLAPNFVESALPPLVPRDWQVAVPALSTLGVDWETVDYLEWASINRDALPEELGRVIRLNQSFDEP